MIAHPQNINKSGSTVGNCILHYRNWMVQNKYCITCNAICVPQEGLVTYFWLALYHIQDWSGTKKCCFWIRRGKNWRMKRKTYALEQQWESTTNSIHISIISEIPLSLVSGVHKLAYLTQFLTPAVLNLMINKMADEDDVLCLCLCLCWPHSR